MAKSIGSLYRSVERAQKKQYDYAKKQSRIQRDNAVNAAETEYRANVTAAQNRARVTALGNEEKLAAAGRNFGSAYDRATSGYTETSRVAQDNNLHSNLTRLATVKSQAVANARSQYASEVAAAAQKRYAALSNTRLQRAKATMSYRQQRYQNALNRWKTYGYVLPADAKVLGVKAGTRTADRAYREAKLAIDRIKALK